MQKYFYPDSSGEYDREFIAKLETCLLSIDDTHAIEAQDGGWNSMNRYFLSNGTKNDYMGQDDTWGSCLPGPDSRCPVGGYQEWIQNPEGATFGENNMVIYEPCNYASNIAYYHSVLRLCDYPSLNIPLENKKALKRSYSTHALVSSMWHGSHTYVGYTADDNMIGVIAYLSY
jgi:hypothetical protein